MTESQNRRFQWVYLFVLNLLVLVACRNDERLYEVVDSKDTGISFENTLNETDDFNIIDYLYFFNGGGVALGDINDDGLPDIFFSGNQVKNKLYLNRGNLRFEDITESAGVAGNSDWNTGCVMGDVNGDGYLDIYVCAVVGLKGLRGHNELYINNGDNTFTERAAEFGLDFDSFSSTAAFLDYDVDGDLDIYLLNHAVHTQESFGKADLRNKRTYETGDKLLRNDNTKFTDVSETAGIYGGINGYGLGVSIADLNVDGYPDIYVGNDFHEDDYLYINNGNGTFREQIKEAFTQVSRFSMGNDVADLNHDGYPDLISLDMLPEDEMVLKRSEGDERLDILELRIREYGYHYQFARNMLQINRGNGTFMETGIMSGVAATDWSWSAIFSDFDQDGHQDLFVANGIPRRPNDLDYIKFVSSEQIRETMDATHLVDKQALDRMPSGAVANKIFSGKGDGSFTDMSAQWLDDDPSFSTAPALADLDNDGDLDIVINNVNAPPSIYINRIDNKAGYLKIRFKYNAENTFGIGTKAYSYHQGQLQYKELYPVEGFQSSSEPLLHFGYGKATVVDSIKIVWPDNRVQVIREIPVNQLLTVEASKELHPTKRVEPTGNRQLFQQVASETFGIDFRHREDRYSDFDRLKLLPYRQSDRGPATAIGDLNGDGRMDIYFGGSKYMPADVYLQETEKFQRVLIPALRQDSINEEVNAVIADFDRNGTSDLLIGTGGADFFGKSAPLLDKVYFSDTALNYLAVELPDVYENSGCVKVFDYDSDGFVDVFIGNQSRSNDFGQIPSSVLLRNNMGRFEVVQEELFQKMGMVTDACWVDYNQDGETDLVVVGEWMSPVFLKNVNGQFERDNVLEQPENGLWQSVLPFDIDQDGDQDLTLGNWGSNSKFTASREYPLLMYYGDFDRNGSTETVVAVQKQGQYYPIEGLDILGKQMVSLRKKFTSYSSFAGKTIDEIFSDEMLREAKILRVDRLESGYLRNDNGRYRFVPFQRSLQVSPIMTQLIYDFDADGSQEVLLGGNYFGVQPFHGRFGSFEGALVKSTTEIITGRELGLNIFNRSVRGLNVLEIGDSPYLLVTINNGEAQLYKFLR